jgi:hypothetical protein
MYWFIVLIVIFISAWFLLGNVWVYSVSSQVKTTISYKNTTVTMNENTENPSTSYEYGPDLTDYCDSFLYYFSFWIITLTWILFLFGLVCPCGFIFLIP